MMTRNEARRAAIARGPLKTTLSRAASKLRVTVTVKITASAAFITNGHRHTDDPDHPSARRWRVHVRDPTAAAALAELFNPCRKAWVGGASSFFVRQGRDVADLVELRRIIREVSA